ncbi:MAG: hypothetical protein U9R01_05320 [candidate division WOR-3 bacterium]|nr:hypothetical protein [candidate division WOR-3 bacterium]
MRGYLEIKPEITGAEVQSILWERSPDLEDLQAIRLGREMPSTIIKSVKSMAKRGGDSILWVSIPACRQAGNLNKWASTNVKQPQNRKEVMLGM